MIFEADKSALADRVCRLGERRGYFYYEESIIDWNI